MALGSCTMQLLTKATVLLLLMVMLMVMLAQLCC
jgi:hypothetical protein